MQPVLIAALLLFTMGFAGAASSEGSGTQTAIADALSDAPLSDLSGTAWQLIRITSMDDSLYQPEADATYTLQFSVDGAISASAGCNRAFGTVSVWDPPKLQLSELASTLAVCGPDSISERYLSDLGWVRSYVYQDHRLYLATMADGSIMEFAPAPTAESSAVIGSLSLTTRDPDALRSIILSRLFDAYAVAYGMSVSEAEINEYLQRKDRQLRDALGDNYAQRSALTPREQIEEDNMEQRLAEAVIRQWKINKSLYEQYGGRVIYQQLGPEPLDAYAALLKQARDAELFNIQSTTLEASFWEYFSDDQRHDFMPAGSDDEARAFSQPPWATRK
ncbi:conserved domain protein [gamma proteobacterium NOR5-3]|nr:conserved domain protein [gamma proteobacterium NOR5-3]